MLLVSTKTGCRFFVNPDAALEAALRDYAEGFAAVSEEFNLDPVNNDNYSWYKKYGWQQPYEDLRYQGIQISKFFDIYENSFSNGNDADEFIKPSSTVIKLEPTSPEWSQEQRIDIVGMAELDYASDDIVIFHGYFGLFVYDLNSLQIIRSLDLKPLNCTAIQGDDYCDVTVSMDGNTVQLHRMSSKNMYVYTVSDNTLGETTFERMSERFGSNFVPIEDVVDSKQLAKYSYNAVRFATGEYGYLHTSDMTLGTLSYVRDDMIYRLFDI